MAKLIYSALTSLEGYLALEGVGVVLELLDERRFGNGMVYLHYKGGYYLSLAGGVLFGELSHMSIIRTRASRFESTTVGR